MDRRLQELYHVAVTSRQAMLAAFETAMQPAQQNPMDLDTLVETVHVLKQAYKHFDELRKEVKRRIEAAERVAGIVAVKLEADPTVRTPYVTATIRVGQVANVPRHDAPEYAALMEWLGLPPEAPVRIHWPDLVDMLTERAANGQALPPGIDPESVKPKYEVRCTKKAEILEGFEHEQDHPLF